METQLTPEEREAYLHEIVHKLASISDAHKLQELSLLAVAMLLRRAESADLKRQLGERIKRATAAAHTPDQVHAAARHCLEIIEEARTRRRPRQQPPAKKSSPKGWLAWGSLLVLLAAGGAVWWGISTQEDVPDIADSALFVEQLVAAAKGEAPPTHMFGGTLEHSSMNGMAVIVAREVPPRVCAATGMRLVKLGLVSINGVTPSRVSSAIVTELCNKEPGNATIMWAPKEP